MAGRGPAQEPLLFISSTQDDGFVVHEEAKQFLSRLSGKIAIVIVAGPYRTGKSFLLNSLIGAFQAAGKHKGFVVGNTINACTKGIWIWGEPVTVGDTTFVFMDSEGLGSLEQHQHFDTHIFSLAVLLSSLFVLNTQGTISESALEQLELVVQCTKRIRVHEDEKMQGDDSEGSANASELAAHFPPFIWVLRDFALQLEDAQGNAITPKQYLEEALRPVAGNRKGLKEKNRIRNTISTVFPQRECVTLVRPVADEKQLQKLTSLPESSLRPEFRQQMAQLQQRIRSLARPKAIDGVSLNGAAFVRLACAYVDAMNAGAIPTIHSAWQSVVEVQSREAVDSAIKLYTTKMAQAFDSNDKTVLEAEALMKLHNSINAECSALLQNAAVGDAAHKNTLLEGLQATLMKMLAERQAKNEQRSDALCRHAIEDLWERGNMDKKLQSCNNAEATQKLFEALQQSYGAKAKGPAKDMVLRLFWERKVHQLQRMLFERLDEMERALTSVKQEKADLQKKLAAAEKTVQEAQQKLAIELERANSKAAHAESDKQRIANEISQQQAEIKSLNKQLTAAQIEANKHEAEMKLSRSSAQQELTALKADKAALEKRAATAEKDAAAMERKMDAAREEARLVQNKLTETQAQLANAQAKSSSSAADKKTIENLNKELFNARADANSKADEHKRAIATLQQQHQQALVVAERQASKQLEQENKRLQDEVATLKQEMAALKRQSLSAAQRPAPVRAAAVEEDDEPAVDQSQDEQENKEPVFAAAAAAAAGNLGKRQRASTPAAGEKAQKRQQSERKVATPSRKSAPAVVAPPAEESDEDMNQENDDAEVAAPASDDEPEVAAPTEDLSKLTVQQLKSRLTALDVTWSQSAKQSKQFFLDLLYQSDPALKGKQVSAGAVAKGKARKSRGK